MKAGPCIVARGCLPDDDDDEAEASPWRWRGRAGGFAPATMSAWDARLSRRTHGPPGAAGAAGLLRAASGLSGCLLCRGSYTLLSTATAPAAPHHNLSWRSPRRIFEVP